MAILHVKKCSNIGTSAIGLIGAKTPYGLFLKTRFGIHTFGVKFPIDVVILDSKQYAVRIKESLPPNRIFFLASKMAKRIRITRWNYRFLSYPNRPAGRLYA